MQFNSAVTAHPFRIVFFSTFRIILKRLDNGNGGRSVEGEMGEKEERE